MSRLSRLAIPAVAAALALAATAPMVADLASAKPARPDWQQGGLRQEVAQLRAELGYYQAAYSELSQGLDRIDAVNRRNRDRRTMMQISRAVRQARDGAAQYVQPWDYEQREPDWRDRDDWRHAPSPPPPPPPPGNVYDRRTQPQPQPVYAQISGSAFASLTQQVAQAGFADDKLALVQTAAAANYFTVAQVIELMKLASFDDTRVEMAVALAPRVIDGDRWFEVYGALSFSASRDALRQRLGGN